VSLHQQRGTLRYLCWPSRPAAMVDHGCDARHSHPSIDEERTSLRLTVL
jgi:hypothetical protein